MEAWSVFLHIKETYSSSLSRHPNVEQFLTIEGQTKCEVAKQKLMNLFREWVSFFLNYSTGLFLIFQNFNGMVLEEVFFHKFLKEFFSKIPIGLLVIFFFCFVKLSGLGWRTHLREHLLSCVRPQVENLLPSKSNH